MKDNNYWNYSASVIEGEKYFIDGLNIWDYKWKDTRDRFLKKDATWQDNHNVQIYEIENNGKCVKFGATEVSNNVWVIYTNYYQPVNQ